MNVETIINGKRLVLREAMPFIEVALPADLPLKDYWTSDPTGPIRPVTIRRQRHRLVRLVAEYELDGAGW